MMVLRMQAEDIRWLITAATQPHRKSRDQKAIWRTIDQLARAGQVLRSTFEMLPDDASRVMWIGQQIKLHGRPWVERHPQHLQWLARHGVSQEEAIRLHTEWQQAESRNEFWYRPDEAKRKRGRRKPRRRERRGS